MELEFDGTGFSSTLMGYQLFENFCLILKMELLGLVALVLVLVCGFVMYFLFVVY